MAVTPSLTLLFADGTRETVNVRPVALMAAERRYGENLPRIEGSLFAAWFSLGKPTDDFDGWVATIEGMEEPSTNGESAAPLAEGPSPAP